jgi:hypothetical protein
MANFTDSTAFQLTKNMSPYEPVTEARVTVGYETRATSVDANASGPNGSRSRNASSVVPVPEIIPSKRFIPQWDDQVVGHAMASCIPEDYNDPPEIHRRDGLPDILMLKYCSPCGLT